MILSKEMIDRSKSACKDAMTVFVNENGYNRMDGRMWFERDADTRVKVGFYEPGPRDILCKRVGL